MIGRQYACLMCGAEFTSKIGAAYCEDADREEDVRLGRLTSYDRGYD